MPTLTIHSHLQISSSFLDRLHPNQKVAELLIHPVQYNAVSGQVRLTTHLVIEIQLDTAVVAGQRHPKYQRVSGRSRPPSRKSLATIC